MGVESPSNMKYIARVNESEFVLDLKLNSESQKIHVEGEDYQVEVEPLSKHHVLTRINGRVFDVLVTETGPVAETMVNGKICRVQITPEKLQHIKQLSGAEAAASGPKPVKAPMPGLVLKILVKEGQKVHRRDGLLVIEAMKMENEIRAERDCQIKKIFVREGEAVDKEQLLIELQ